MKVISWLFLSLPEPNFYGICVAAAVAAAVVVVVVVVVTSQAVLKGATLLFLHLENFSLKSVKFVICNPC